jgi:hypothetical protein
MTTFGPGEKPPYIQSEMRLRCPITGLAYEVGEIWRSDDVMTARLEPVPILQGRNVACETLRTWVLAEPWEDE